MTSNHINLQIIAIFLGSFINPKLHTTTESKNSSKQWSFRFRRPWGPPCKSDNCFCVLPTPRMHSNYHILIKNGGPHPAPHVHTRWTRIQRNVVQFVQISPRRKISLAGAHRNYLMLLRCRVSGIENRYGVGRRVKYANDGFVHKHCFVLLEFF